MRRLRLTIAALAIGALLAAACGDDDAEPAGSGPANEATSEVATEEAAAPQAIISLSPTATEMLYAIGAADQILAVDDLSNYPEEAAAKMQGLSGFEPNVEAIAGLEPDLVITDGTNPDFLAQLDTLGIPHWEGVAPSTIDDALTQIEALGAVVGREEQAAATVAAMRADVDAALADLPTPAEPLTYYHELDSTYFSVSSATFIGAVYAAAGLVNIVDLADSDPGAYPQLTAEYIVESDPDLIFLACTKYCGETADTVAARPGWGGISAVTSGNVVELDDDIASRWGPRLVEYVRAVAAAVQAAA